MTEIDNSEKVLLENFQNSKNIKSNEVEHL